MAQWLQRLTHVETVLAPEKSSPGLTNFMVEGGGMRKANDDRAFFLCGETVGALLLPSEPASPGEEGLNPGSGELNLLALSKRAQTVTSVAF